MSDNLEERYFELFDLWKACKADGDKLDAKFKKAFAQVASEEGANVLMELDSLRKHQQQLWDEMQKILGKVGRR